MQLINSWATWLAYKKFHACQKGEILLFLREEFCKKEKKFPQIAFILARLDFNPPSLWIFSAQFAHSEPVCCAKMNKKDAEMRPWKARRIIEKEKRGVEFGSRRQRERETGGQLWGQSLA